MRTVEHEIRDMLREELRELRADVKAIKDEMITLKVKVAMFSAFIGFVASTIATFIVEKVTRN